MAATTLDPGNVAAIFKAYDVRGTVPDQIDEDLARATGRAYVQVTGADQVVVGYDMRPSSPGMAGAFADGATQAGAGTQNAISISTIRISQLIVSIQIP